MPVPAPAHDSEPTPHNTFRSPLVGRATTRNDGNGTADSGSLAEHVGEVAHKVDDERWRGGVGLPRELLIEDLRSRIVGSPALDHRYTACARLGAPLVARALVVMLCDVACDGRPHHPPPMTHNSHPPPLEVRVDITIPVEITDPTNARILAVSEDRIAGFLSDPFAEIARRAELPLDVVLERIRAMLA